MDGIEIKVVGIGTMGNNVLNKMMKKEIIIMEKYESQIILLLELPINKETFYWEL